MKNLITTILMLFLGAKLAFAQPTLSLTPNPSGLAICPLVSTTFTINGIPQNCTSYTITLFSGTTTAFSTNGNTFTLSAADIPQQLVVRIQSTGNQTCTFTRDFTIPVKSISTSTPTMTICTSGLVAGISHILTVSATLFYPFKGSLDPSEVASYTWAITSGGTGWTLTTTSVPGVVAKFARFVTDDLSGATISVTATSHCGRTSLPFICVIPRFAEVPTITGVPAYVVCENTNPITLSASQATAGLSGYTYSWNFGSWSGTVSPTPGSGAFVTPDGTTDGSITVTSTVGTYTASTVVTIPVVVIEPSTMVIGDPFLCEQEERTYKLDVTQPGSFISTWAVSPENAVQTSSGSGQEAVLLPRSGYSGFATITFTITNDCGTATRSLQFFVGKPKIGSGLINGQPLGTFNQICPRKSGSNYISVSLEGDADNCVDYWTVSGGASSWFGTCTEFDWVWQPTSSPVYITAHLSNECGEVSQSYVVMAVPWGCQSEIGKTDPVFDRVVIQASVPVFQTSKNTSIESVFDEKLVDGGDEATPNVGFEIQSEQPLYFLRVFDLSGRQLFQLKNIDLTTVHLNSLLRTHLPEKSTGIFAVQAVSASDKKVFKVFLE